MTLLACGPSPTGPKPLAWVTIPAHAPEVQYIGRTHVSDEGVVFSHPGVTIRTSFWGDALRMRLHDAGAGGETGTNYFDVSIDGAPPTLLGVRSDEPLYPLASGLAQGLHTVELTRRTETLVGTSEFVAFEVHGEVRMPPARSPLRVEFVGDSITCAYGTGRVVFPRPPPWSAPTFTSKNQDPRLGYGWLTAQALGAEPSFVCYSGHGVYRNLDQTTTGLIPAIYELAVPDTTVAWDFTGPSPDVIVVNAGTNDTFAGAGTDEDLPDETAFKTAYRTFLARLRALHPRAHIICTLGSMTNGYKEVQVGGEVRSVHVGEWISHLVEERRQQGDTRVHRHVMQVQNPDVDGVGEDWHPSAATHRKMAVALTEFIQALLNP
ncbi:GDSL-type esterase/lipase family protein [Myxococcus sp. K15C18031901]|uniref:SGNH/GDSL hydrolase family protein n=1 Tax=Myxococcus dinghuensis TaxID=2906761 RepID=UPI0020A76360|nr:GDSL-type esterase/lipase family protein [Myxococcus dinghuensis]MCP3097939.1 GDSL-type esterase/lipase family protein [Myxococcus dinghuensis]